MTIMKTSHIHRGRGLWKTIKGDITLLYRALKHPKTSVRVKVLIVGLVIYVVSPLDIIPGWILGIGIIDDL